MNMNIIVCIKQVPCTDKVKIDTKTGTLIRKGIPTMMNPNDKHVLSEALALKKKHDGKITVLSMGPKDAEEILREALALGADQAILLCDKLFAGSDTRATANVLGSAIKILGNYDILLFGKETIDGETAQVGGETAEFLGIPQISYAQSIDIQENKIIVKRQMDGYCEIIESEMPCLITCLPEIAKAEYPTIYGIKDAYRNKEIKVWNIKDIGVDENEVGLNGSFTIVKKVFSPSAKAQGQMLKGLPKELAKKIIDILKAKEIILKQI